MRLLYLTDSYRPSRSACANRAVVLSEAMRESGIDVHILASSDSLLDALPHNTNPNYVSFFPTYPLQSKTAINRLRNNLSSFVSAIKVAETLGEFDAVLCSSPPLMLTLAATSIAKQLQAKLILDIRDIWPDVAYEMGSFTPHSLYGRVFEKIAKHGFEKADLICTVSPGKLRKLQTKQSINPNKLILVPNGLDETFIQSPIQKDVVSKYHLNTGSTCVYIGNLGLAQGLRTLITLANRFPHTRFLLFGQGAEEESLRHLVREKNVDNVEFCGVISAAEAFSVLNYATVAYVPLLNSKLKDSIPTKLFEALGAGCPVLLAAVGDAANVLDEAGLGIHVPPEDIEGQAKALSTLIEKPYKKEDRERAKNYVAEKHSRQKIAARFSNELTAKSSVANGRAS